VSSSAAAGIVASVRSRVTRMRLSRNHRVDLRCVRNLDQLADLAILKSERAQHLGAEGFSGGTISDDDARLDCDTIAVNQLGRDFAALEAEVGNALTEGRRTQGRVSLHASRQCERALVARQSEHALGMKSCHQFFDVTVAARGVGGF